MLDHGFSPSAKARVSLPPIGIDARQQIDGLVEILYALMLDFFLQHGKLQILASAVLATQLMVILLLELGQLGYVGVGLGYQGRYRHDWAWLVG